MGLKQQPKCKDKTCKFCTGKYCTILKQKPDVCRFYKAKEIKQYVELNQNVLQNSAPFAVPEWTEVLKND